MGAAGLITLEPVMLLGPLLLTRSRCFCCLVLCGAGCKNRLVVKMPASSGLGMMRPRCTLGAKAGLGSESCQRDFPPSPQVPAFSRRPHHQRPAFHDLAPPAALASNISQPQMLPLFNILPKSRLYLPKTSLNRQYHFTVGAPHPLPPNPGTRGTQANTSSSDL